MCVRPILQRAGYLILISAMLFGSGCGSRSTTETDASVQKVARQQRVRHENVNFSSMDVEGFDIDGDGEADVLHYSKNGVLRIARYDLDFDGRIDMDAYYDEEGRLEERSFYLNDDEAVDVIALYEAEALVEKYVSIDFDEQFPVAKYYGPEGDLLRVERDSDGDGHTDVWEYYDAGELVRVARDTDGDGSPDQVSEIQ